MVSFFENYRNALHKTFIVGDRWKYFTTGLGNTLNITFYALLIGIAVGVIIALVRSSWDRISPSMKRGFGRFMLQTANAACKVYLTIIRGTPVLVQLMIIYFIFVRSSDLKAFAGIIAFGINSGAYVAEIVRSGIMSIDSGQNEAGRSLGFNYVQTMWYIVLPQAFKNILPALGNEFIVLLKETSVIGTIGATDLLRGANIVMDRTFEAVVPLFTVAVIYLAMVMLFTWLVGILERRLRNSDH